MLTSDLQDRTRRCLLAGALGDAWGGPYEGRPACESPSFRASPRISDDTMLTLATCEALISNAGQPNPESIAARFVVWFKSGRLEGLGSGTLKALRDLSAGAHWALAGVRGEYAAGSGPAMQVAPLAFVLDPTRDDDRRTLRDISRITHHSDEAYVGALAILLAIRRGLDLDSVPSDLLSYVVEYLPDTALRDRLEELVSSPLSVAQAALTYGNSGYVVEAVPLALLTAVQTSGHPVEDTITTAISLGGDTDTIASMAAQIAGAAGHRASEELLGQIGGVAAIRSAVEGFSTLLSR